MDRRGGVAMRISVVVPVYNSEASLQLLVERLQPVLSNLGAECELILVNDGSRDGSWDAVCRITDANSWVRGIDLMRNYGQHNALLCGIRAARGDVIVTMDDDLQNPPEEIPRLLERLTPDCDVVYGTPRQEKHGFLRDMASRVTKLALKGAMGVDIARNVSAFRAFRTKVRDAFATYQGSYTNIDVLLTWGTVRFAAVPVRHDERRLGVSNYTLVKLVTHAFNMITSFSMVPLQLASMIGFAFTIFGIAILFIVIGRFILQGGVVPGFAFLACTIAIFSGAQLFAIGIIGEYLARVHFRIMDRPTYVERGRISETED
jgi:glycosyltransferase involved in cell wall biosynthesis